MKMSDEMDMDQPSDDSLSPEETARRRDAALRLALNAPPQPKHGKIKKSNPAVPLCAPNEESLSASTILPSPPTGVGFGSLMIRWRINQAVLIAYALIPPDLEG